MRVLSPRKSRRGWTILPVHYSMDPEKTSQWQQNLRAGYLRAQDWAREMEIDFSESGGVRATPSFKAELHVRDDIYYSPILPLCLAVDFNRSPLVWEIAQIVKNELHCIDEIALDPGAVPDAVREFRNKYPAHAAEIWLYGDASGKALTAHDQQSDYDLMFAGFRGYPATITSFVPTKNPPVRDSLNAVELKLKGVDGRPTMWVHPRCEYLVKDLAECLLDEHGRLLKTHKKDDPYQQRTHALDDIRYLCSREWPTAWTTDPLPERKTTKQPKYAGRIPGDLF